MAKPFSQMTETEKRINRARLAAGKPANYSEQMGYDHAGVRLAMDAAQRRLNTVALDYMRARDAVEARAPHLALDSAKDAAGVYAIALRAAGVDVAGVDRSAYRALYEASIGGGIRRQQMAHDAAHVKGFDQRFPNAARIKKG